MADSRQDLTRSLTRDSHGTPEPFPMTGQTRDSVDGMA